MKIVLPIYRERISPVFDWSMKVLLVEIKSNDELKKKEIDISLLSDIERIYVLERMENVTLLCGGISLQLEEIIKYLGINVIPWISGYANDILSSFLEGTLIPEEHLMPGVKVRKRRRFPVNNVSNSTLNSECYGD